MYNHNLYIKNINDLTVYKDKFIIKKKYESYSYYFFTPDLLENKKNIFLNYVIKSNTMNNEMLIPGRKRKIYLDIEKIINIDEVKSGIEEEMVENIDRNLKQYLYDTKNKIDFKILYLKGSRKLDENKYKISYHIIINNYGAFNDNIKMYKFVENFKKGLDPDIGDAIDMSVYNKNQAFRMAYSSSKTGASGKLFPFYYLYGKMVNINLYELNNDNFWDLFVTDYRDKEESLDFLIPDIFTQKQNYDYKIPENVILYIENKYTDNFKINKCINNIVHLIRKNQSMCEVCNIVHERENAYLVYHNKRIYFHCYREKNLNISGVEVYKDPSNENLEKRNQGYDSNYMLKYMYNTNNFLIEKIKNICKELEEKNKKLVEQEKIISNLTIHKNPEINIPPDIKEEIIPNIKTENVKINSRAYRTILTKLNTYRTSSDLKAKKNNSMLDFIQNKIFPERYKKYLSNNKKIDLIYKYIKVSGRELVEKSGITLFMLLDLSIPAFESFLKLL